ncbi:MAG: MarR family transcriptional regulator [Pseudomonadota bacterium]|nr:MarR family transcriptional regulator [Pseudomonadota bacterium]
MSRPADPGIDPAVDFLADLPEQVVDLLYQVHRRREASLAVALEAAGLPLAIWRMLLALQCMQPCTMNTLARYTTVERTALTRVLDQMVKQDLALRTTPPEDRRQVLVTLTGPGLEAFEKGRRIITRWNRKALGGMSAERLETLRETINEFLHNMIPDEELAEDIITFNHRSKTGG